MIPVPAQPEKGAPEDRIWDLYDDENAWKFVSYGQYGEENGEIRVKTVDLEPPKAK